MKNDARLSQLEDHVGYWLRCLSNFVHEGFEARLAQYKISVAQWVVLRTLFDSNGLSLQEAAYLVGVDKSSLSRMIDRLLDKGLVLRTEGKDRRSLSVALSIEGRRLVPKLAFLADHNDAQFFKALTVDERKTLLDSIKKLLEVNKWHQSQRGHDRMK